MAVVKGGSIEVELQALLLYATSASVSSFSTGLLTIALVVSFIVMVGLWIVRCVVESHDAMHAARREVYEERPAGKSKGNALGYRERVAKAVYFRNVLDLERTYHEWVWVVRDDAEALREAETVYADAIDAMTSCVSVEKDDMYS